MIVTHFMRRYTCS